MINPILYYKKGGVFYESIFDNLDLSFIPEFIESKRGPKGYSRHALTRAFIVMNCNILE